MSARGDFMCVCARVRAYAGDVCIIVSVCARARVNTCVYILLRVADGGGGER